jgi:hypothetical protein
MHFGFSAWRLELDCRQRCYQHRVPRRRRKGWSGAKTGAIIAETGGRIDATIAEIDVMIGVATAKIDETTAAVLLVRAPIRATTRPALGETLKPSP